MKRIRSLLAWSKNHDNKQVGLNRFSRLRGLLSDRLASLRLFRLAQMTRQHIRLVLCSLLIGVCVFGLLTSIQRSSLGSLLFEKFYLGMSTLGIGCEDIAHSERLENGCIRFPRNPPSWVIILEFYVVPGMSIFVSVFLALLFYSRDSVRKSNTVGCPNCRRVLQDLKNWICPHCHTNLQDW